ncbi:MAG: hypothetical protein J7578_20645 [Chitinophagaceae bacterium]|nr:hypothetical protein [Chitinophagaceae bacterium]
MDCLPRLTPLYPLFLLSLFATSCHRKPPAIQKAYYYWRSGDMETSEQQFLKQHDIHKLYARLMDIDWNEVQGAIPVSTARIDDIERSLRVYDSFAVEMVPVVFITNRSFEKIAATEIPLLAKRLVRRCLPAFDETDKQYEKSRHINTFSVKEIQFDCDWTTKTAATYFQFLKEARALAASKGVIVSATIRLHQFKYPDKTGIPPVDRGMLMAYNISNPRQYSTTNSIYDQQKAEAYFTGKKKYPLPLDLALPAWSWCLIYRNKEFYQIENGLMEKELDQLAFLKKGPDHFYTVITDTVFHGLFLRNGDEIKSESIPPATLQNAARLARKAVNTDSFTVSLFELSQSEFNQYTHETIDQVYDSFR